MGYKIDLVVTERIGRIFRIVERLKGMNPTEAMLLIDNKYRSSKHEKESKGLTKVFEGFKQAYDETGKNIETIIGLKNVGAKERKR